MSDYEYVTVRIGNNPPTTIPTVLFLPEMWDAMGLRYEVLSGPEEAA